MLPLLFSIFFFLNTVNSQYRFDCDVDYCTKKGKCPELDCEGGRIIENVTQCGCCGICLKNLEEGQECITSYHEWIPNIAECGHGLICNQTKGIKGTCIPSECLKKVKKYEKEFRSAEEGFRLKKNFGCDHFGNFKPVVCLDDVFCFCVDQNGTRMFGTDLGTNNETINCNCSRDIRDFPREVDTGQIPRCLANGNYDPLQCVENKCFCMNTRSNIDDNVVFHNISDIKKLSCYNLDRHGDERKTDCLKEREDQMKLFKKENLTVVAVDLTRCEIDGTYSPLQCKKGRCYCVTSTGELHRGYEDVKMKHGQMTCRCLRDKEILSSAKTEKTSNMEEFEKIKCDGNYTSDKIGSFFRDFMK